MEDQVKVAEIYDYQKCDRVWRRVAPELNPYPEARAAAETQRAPTTEGISVPAFCAPETESAPMPEARTAAVAENTPAVCDANDTDVARRLCDAVERELAGWRAYQYYARCAPAHARRRLQQIAAEKECHARRLRSVYFLMTGACCTPASPALPEGMPAWCDLLRRLFQEESEGAARYEAWAREIGNSCLEEIFDRLAENERRHARQILQLLEKGGLA